MIKSFRDSWLETYFVNDKHFKKIPASINDRLFRKLQLIDDAESDVDLRIPPSNCFEKLYGMRFILKNVWRALKRQSLLLLIIIRGLLRKI